MKNRTKQEVVVNNIILDTPKKYKSAVNKMAKMLAKDDPDGKILEEMKKLEKAGFDNNYIMKYMVHAMKHSNRTDADMELFD